MTVTSNPASAPQQEEVVVSKDVQKQPTMHLKTQYYKGTLSSPFAMDIISKMGFLPLPERSNLEWQVQLFNRKNCPVKANQLKGMSESQRHSRFPKSEHITKKNKLVKSFRKADERGVTGLDFLPHTFVLPEDWNKFRKCMSQEKNESEKSKEKSKEKATNQLGGPWIIKPYDAAGGHGISLVNNLSEIGYLGMGKKVVVSQYIANPLLIDGLKFDMRLYVLVTSFTPLHIYFFSDGLARFCTEQYPADKNDISDLLAHLTNTSLNCHSEKFAFSGDMNDKTGHTRSLQSVMERLKNEGVNIEKIQTDIHQLVIKTFTAIQPTVEKAVSGNVPHKRNCFQLFGLDVMLDDQLKPWLLEVNGNPCLEPYTTMEVPIKARLVRDMFRTVGLHVQEDVKHTKKRESRRKGDFTLIFPYSIHPRSGKRKPGQKAAFGLRWDEIVASPNSDVAPVTSTEATLPVEKVEEKVAAPEKVEEKLEEIVEVPVPPMVPCC